MGDFLHGLRAVMAFEGRRLLARPRVIYLVLLFLFPLGMGWVLLVEESGVGKPGEATIYMYSVYAQIVCPLAMLLLCPTAISSEVAGGTWTFLAVRPAGRTAVLLGKYLSAALGCAVLSVLSLQATLTLMMTPDNASEVRLGLTLASALSPFAFGALFNLLGMLFIRRAMAACLVYTMIVEMALGSLPAVVNQLTISHALRSLAIAAMNPSVASGLKEAGIADPSYPRNLLALGLIIGGTLGVACMLLERRELVNRGSVAS